MRFFACLLVIGVAMSAYAGLPDAVHNAIYNEDELELLCHSPYKTPGTLIVATYDDDLRNSKTDELAIDDFPANIWYFETLAGKEPKLTSVAPGKVEFFSKQDANLKDNSAADKTFTTWIIKTNLPSNNPRNYYIWTIDRSVSFTGATRIAAQIVNSPFATTPRLHTLECPIFKLK